jgi:hypothetical protein
VIRGENVAQRKDPQPPYEPPSVEEIDTGGEPISTAPGDGTDTVTVGAEG